MTKWQSVTACNLPSKHGGCFDFEEGIIDRLLVYIEWG